MNIKKGLLLPCVLLILSNSGSACLNMFHTVDKHGNVHEIGMEGFIGFNKNFNYQLMNRKLPQILKQIEETSDPRHLSDYAVLLMKAGKVDASLSVFQSLQRNYPEEYAFASNLGTAYELVGELDSALKYIQLGMTLNENAHGGSEWVHVVVLETKKRLEQDSTYLENHTVLELSEAAENDTAVMRQLEIQVRERFPFSPGPNAIMASLMVDLGDCYANNKSFELAKAFYNIAEKYFGASHIDLDPKITRMGAYRREHSAITVPEEQRISEGENIILKGVRYNSIMDDNNDPPFEIVWEEHEINPEVLLARVDLKMPVFEEVTKNLSEDTLSRKNSEAVSEAEEATEEQEESNMIVIIMMALATFGGMLFIVFLKRRK